MGWTLAGWLGQRPAEADRQPLLADMPGDDNASTGAANACALTWHDLPQLMSVPALHANTRERLHADARKRLHHCDSARDAHSTAGSCASTRASCAGWSRFQQACAGLEGDAQPDACPHCAGEGPRSSDSSLAFDSRRCSSAWTAPTQRPAPSAPAEPRAEQQGGLVSAPGPAAARVPKQASHAELPCSQYASVVAGCEDGLDAAAQPLSPRMRVSAQRWQSSGSERGAARAASPPPPWRRDRRLSSAESAASAGRCRKAESRAASASGDGCGGRRLGGVARGEAARGGEQRGLPGSALMVAGPRAAVAGQQMWVAVGPDMRPLPLLHAPPAGADGLAGAAAHPRAAEAARAWRSERRWVALWAAVAALTLAHTVTLVFALGASALSLACAALFAWVALLGVGGALRGLAAAASADTHAGQFAANLRATELAAFLAGALAGLAAGVYLLVLHLFLRKAPLPPCAPDQRICAETYNLLLVLMVATVALYSGHALIAGLVCAKARNARQLLGGCWPGASPPGQAGYVC